MYTPFGFFSVKKTPNLLEIKFSDLWIYRGPCEGQSFSFHITSSFRKRTESKISISLAVWCRSVTHCSTKSEQFWSFMRQYYTLSNTWVSVARHWLLAWEVGYLRAQKELSEQKSLRYIRKYVPWLLQSFLTLFKVLRSRYTENTKFPCSKMLKIEKSWCIQSDLAL